MNKWPLFVGMVLTALLTAGCRAPAPKPAPVAPSAGGPAEETDYTWLRPNPLVSRSLKDIVAGVSALKDKHPELADWNATVLAKSYLIYYVHDCKVVRPGDPRRREVVFGPNGIFVHVAADHQSPAEHDFASIGIRVHVSVSVGKKGNKALAGRIRGIIEGKLEPLRQADKAAGKALKGMVADMAAIKDKYPELSKWHDDRLKVPSTFTYSHNCTPGSGAKGKWTPPKFGPNGCFVQVWISPDMGQRCGEYGFPELGLEVHVSVGVAKDGNQGFAKEIRAIIGKNLAPLGKLDRKYGGRERK